ncbi:MAG: LCP family protein [Acutalibacteraceae bacterium]|nr:LCP family protein [Acutalibacteraceae bacterium]
MKKLRAFISIIAVIAIISVMFSGCSLFSKKENSESDEPSHTQTTTSVAEDVIAPEDVTWNGDMFEAINNDGLLNILLIGQDRRPDEGRQRSDCMILCSLNPETKELSMISFLRDLYVQIPGHSDNRLNAAYVYGGFDLIKETLEHNFGVAVDGCLEVDFDSFEQIVDILGGVEIELTSAEAEIVGSGATEGLCHLNGAQALTYTRIRKIDSDFQRTARQRTLLNAVFSKMKGCTVTELMTVVGEILPLMTTDMTDEELMSFAFNLASSLSELRIENYGVPSSGNYQNATINGMAVLVPDLYEIKKLIFEEYLPV